MGKLNLQMDRYYLDANVVISVLERTLPLTRSQASFLAGIDNGDVDCASSELALAECLVRPFRDGLSDNIAAILSFLDDRSELPLLKPDRACFMGSRDPGRDRHETAGRSSCCTGRNGRLHNLHQRRRGNSVTVIDASD
ncbi:MAG: hypothetical protein R3D34_14550 [Nitratireductor sp.]